MKRLTLDIDNLQVESFEMAEETEAAGTVYGQQGTVNINCYTRQGSCHRTECCPETTLC